MTTTPNAPDAALLPCAHCGGKALLIRPHNGANPYVMCNAKYCTAPKPTEEEAIAAWNDRAGQSHADAGLLAALEAAYRRGYDEGAEDALEEGETPFKDTQNDGWRNYSAAIAAAKGA